MIDIDKCKAAFAGSTLCQKEFYKPGTELRPEMLCAVSALASYAGLEPRLIAKFTDKWRSFMYLVAPVLEVEYGIPMSVTERIPGIFDNQPNEWRAVQAVLDLFETHNRDEMHDEAIAEDRRRFPREEDWWITTGAGITIDWASGSIWANDHIVYSYCYDHAPKAKVVKELDAPKSKYLPAPKPIKSSPMVAALNAFATTSPV